MSNIQNYDNDHLLFVKNLLRLASAVFLEGIVDSREQGQRRESHYDRLRKKTETQR